MSPAAMQPIRPIPSLLALSLVLAVSAFAPANAAAATADPAAWAAERPERPAAVLVRGATVWTSGPEGRLEGADLLVRDGRIAAVGRDLGARSLPEGAVIIDGAGKHVTAGLIDAHSHTAVDGSVNEGTDIVTAEVRIADVLNPDDVDIYRQLAGGVTAANILHGSANAIGGQNAVVKYRWGAAPSELLFDAAPPGVKFALGENPKQSNWNAGEQRYPQTRMGIEQAIIEAFETALDYRRALEAAARAGEDAVPPRPDLRSEAVLEILDGARHVHAHAYRADEMLMLLGLAEHYGFDLAAFQHALEAYKIADELAAQGVGASTFSDWWAYKYEVVDAIPYNGAILLDRGVVTSFNSDSDELARRLNTEAAKAVRYGGVSEEEALKLVTLYPAIQLGIGERVGSLEPGKDADFVLWNGHPLSTYTLAEQTWVDGRKYFDRAEDLARREEIAAEREALLAEIEAAAGGDGEEAAEAAEGEQAPEGEEEEPSEEQDEETPPQRRDLGREVAR
ncbi:MAG: amidohydrolase [Acidobacteriota bacterium]|jgi:imidazolonepropionase-like amidohydrolase